MQPALHRGHGQVQDLTGLDGGKPLNVSKHEHGAVVRRQLGDGFFKPLRELFPFELVIRQCRPVHDRLGDSPVFGHCRA